MRILTVFVVAVLWTVFVALLVVAAANAHWKPGTEHNRIHAINVAFCDGRVNGCPLGNEALRVSDCESPGYWPYSTNGQYWGAFQFGKWARGRFGFAWNIWEQARAAHRYYRYSGWSGWACKP